MLLVAAGWAAAAVLAVLVGITAIGLIGAGLITTGERPRTEAQVARDLANLPSGPAGPRASSPPASEGVGEAPGAGRTLLTRGGTVVARCVAGRAEIVAMSPAPGYALHEQDDDEGEFRSTSDGHDRDEFDVVCTGDRPALVSRAGD
ncbi:hypothetical protein Asp14428_24860 [Actinoplanes sp. NBRC 14428]|uniref:Septum formation initiator n=2 Tax=Pseudosporangium ferrugineum TaxID=439699 RepID=A0A2T0S9C3_9ACTN|nr:hypothetical protein CLV70_105206 [Pseudosporangium ferrugineum]BCJ51011.1 hypothetical protein Asp14428_24860 [Actinoplanes sp. NBRC 14428]